MRPARNLIAYLALVTLLTGTAWAVLVTSGWFDFLALGVPGCLGVLVAWHVWAARNGVAGFELVLLGIGLAVALVAAAITGRPGAGPPLLVLPLAYAAATCLGVGIGLVGLNQTARPGQSGPLVALVSRLALASLVLVLGGTLYWLVIVSARGGQALIAMLGHAVFVIVLATAFGPVLARGARSVGPVLVVFAAPWVVAVLVAGGAPDLHSGLLHAAAIQVVTVALALPAQAMVDLVRGERSPALVMFLGGTVALLLGWDSGTDLWQALRFTERLDAAELLLRIGLPAVIAAGGLLASGASFRPVATPRPGLPGLPGGDQAETGSSTGARNA